MPTEQVEIVLNVTDRVSPSVAAAVDELDEHLAKRVATELDESNAELILKIVKLLGPLRVHPVFAETKEIVANGGMKTQKGDRDRTPGGIFFYLIRGRCSREERTELWPDKWYNQDKPDPIPRMEWPKAVTAARKMSQIEKGDLDYVQLKIIGRPRQVARAKTCAIVVLAGGPPSPTLPRGVPKPPDETNQVVTCFMSLAQWERVAEDAKKKGRALRVHGFPIFNPNEGTTMLLAETVDVIKRKPKDDPDDTT